MGNFMTVGNDPGQLRSYGEGGRPSARATAQLVRRLIEDVRHSVDLAELADFGPRRWSDMLLAETRFHLAGMINAIELAIGLHLTDARIEALLGDLGAGYCRQAIERELGLLSPEFLAHLRRRAAISLLLRQDEAAGGRGSLASLGHVAMNERYVDTLTALGIAERRWCAPMILETPMRPDLPAEQYHDLVWSVAALLIQACEQSRGAGDPAAVRSIADAAERLIARHDEGQGAFALAQRCARSLPREMRLSLAPAALVDARLLLFAALAECETGLPVEHVIDALIEGADEPRQAILRLMQIDDAVAFRTAELLAPLTGVMAGGDAALATFLEDYRLFDATRAEAWLARMSSPRPLVEKLALMDRPR